MGIIKRFVPSNQQQQKILINFLKNIVYLHITVVFWYYNSNMFLKVEQNLFVREINENDTMISLTISLNNFA